MIFKFFYDIACAIFCVKGGGHPEVNRGWGVGRLKCEKETVAKGRPYMNGRGVFGTLIKGGGGGGGGGGGV